VIGVVLAVKDVRFVFLTCNKSFDITALACVIITTLITKLPSKVIECLYTHNVGQEAALILDATLSGFACRACIQAMEQ
jgi:hypothetical protein